MAESKISVKIEADGAAKFVADLNKAEGALKKFSAATKGLSGSTIGTNGINGALSSIGQKLDSTAQKGQSFASKLSGAFGKIATGALLKIGALIVDLGIKLAKFTFDKIKEGVKLIGDFGAKLNEFKVIAGADIGAGGLAGFEKLFLSFGKQGVDGIEAASAANELLRGGLDATIIKQRGLQDAINLSKAGNIDYARSAEIIVKEFAAFGKKGITTTQIVDQISRVANKSSVGIDDLSLGVANATNAVIGFNDQVALTGFGVKFFGSTASAGTGVRNFAENFIPKTKKAIDAQKKLGLFSKKTGSAFFDQKGEFIGAAKASDLLEKSVKGLTSEQKQLLFNAAFSAKGEKVALALAEGGFRDFEKQVASAADASEQATGINKGLNASFAAATASAKNVAEGLRGVVEPALTGLIQGAVVPGIDALGKLSQKFFAADGAGGKFLAGIAPAANSIGGFFTDLGNGASIGDALKKQIGPIDLGSILKGALGGIGKIDFSGIFSGIGSAISSLNPTLGAAVAQFGATFNQLVSIATAIGSRVISAISSIGPGILTALGQILSGISGVISGILTFLSGLGTGITQIFQGDVLGGLSTVGQGFLDAFQPIRAGLANIFFGIISAVATFAAGIVQALTGIDVSGFVSDVTRGFMVLPIAIKGVQESIGSLLGGLADSFAKLQLGDFSGAASAFTAAFDGIPASLAKVNTDIATELAKIDAAKPPAPQPIDIPAPNTSAFTAGIATVQQQASGAGTAAVTPITIPSPDTSLFAAGIATVQQQASGIGAAAIAPIVIPPPDTSGFASAVSAAQSTVGQIRAAFAGVNLSAQGSAAGASFAAGLRSQAGAAQAAGAALVNAARAGASGAAGGFNSVGAQIAAGLAAGIRSGIGGAISAAVALVNAAKSAAQGAAGIQSPSKVWRKEVGLQMGKGTGLGFADSIKSVNRMVDSSMRQVAAYGSGRVNQPLTSPRTFNRTVNNNSTSSSTRNMPVTIVTRASARESLAELALYAAMGQLP